MYVNLFQIPVIYPRAFLSIELLVLAAADTRLHTHLCFPLDHRKHIDLRVIVALSEEKVDY